MSILTYQKYFRMKQPHFPFSMARKKMTHRERQLQEKKKVENILAQRHKREKEVYSRWEDRPLPSGRGNWKARRQSLLREYVEPYVVSRQRCKKQERIEAATCLEKMNLEDIDVDVVMLMKQLVNDVGRVNDFPEFIIDFSANPRVHTKYRRIHYFSTFDDGVDIRDIRNKP